uniref:Uncharacterized protein n=1 Tax=Thermofilum pendens TaxID=2269 RepID=A0A7J3X5L7_THEPE
MRITLDESARRVVFSVEPKVRVAEYIRVEEFLPVAQPVAPRAQPEVPPIEGAMVQEVVLQLPSNFNADDLSQRLVALSNIAGGSLALASFSLDTDTFTLKFELRQVDPKKLQGSEVKTVLNLMSRLSGAAGREVSLRVSLGGHLPEEEVKKVLGDYYRMVRGVDRFLP